MQQEPVLPPKSTAASAVRFDLARQLADHCPTALAAAIALTGSSARGLAGAGSDAEVNHWVERLPTPSARADWLLEAGVRALEAELAPRSDASEWFSGEYGGVPFEMGWHTFDALETSLQPLLTGDSVEIDRLRLAELLVSAVPLRTDPRLNDLREALAAYPDALRDRLIADLSATLIDEARWAALESLARRDERLIVMRQLGDLMTTAVRLLFAVNRRWDAGDKWLLTLAARLPQMPPDWRARMNTSLSASPETAVALVHAWCDDALSLIS